MSACVITNMLHFRYSKNLPELNGSWSIYIVTHTRYDYGTEFKRHDILARVVVMPQYEIIYITIITITIITRDKSIIEIKS